MERNEETEERTIKLAMNERGGLYMIFDSGGNAPNLRVVVSAHPFIQRRALEIVRRYFPAYRAKGAELHLFGKMKRGAAV